MFNPEILVSYKVRVMRVFVEIQYIGECQTTIIVVIKIGDWPCSASHDWQVGHLLVSFSFSSRQWARVDYCSVCALNSTRWGKKVNYKHFLKILLLDPTRPTHGWTDGPDQYAQTSYSGRNRSPVCEFFQDKPILLAINKKLSYRRETARQLRVSTYAG